MKKILICVIATVMFSTYCSAELVPNEVRDRFLDGSLSWGEVEQQAAIEGEINFYHWGGDDRLNVWLDTVVSPALAEQGIKLNTRRLTSTREAVDLVLTENRSGKGLGEGSVDAIWVNGENFYTLAEQELLFGSFADKLPNSDLFEWSPTDPRSHLNRFDFGYPTQAREVPWGGEQYVCAVNPDLMPANGRPRDFKDLESWLHKNPGLFAYVKPPHYLGNTMVLQALYEFNPAKTGADPFQLPLSSYTAEELADLIEPGMDYLRRISPYLANVRGGQPRYPADVDGLMNMFRNSEIAMECQFGLYHVPVNIRLGLLPEFAEETIFPQGNMIKNKNYLVVPGNTGNPAAALVFANYMSSFEAQLSKTSEIGYPAGIDLWKLTDEQSTLFAQSTPKHVGVTQAQLDQNAAPDTNSSLVTVIEKVWIAYVEQGSDKSVVELVRQAMQ